MDIFSAIFLGIVQGLTEFLPISSTGHLILARDFFGISGEYGLSVDAVLQLATALAIGIYFFRDFLRAVFFKTPEDRTFLIAIAAATIPAIVFGLLLEEYMETVFRSSLLVAGTLIAGALIMWAAEKYGKVSGELTYKKGFLIGLFQSLALIPGMSRSGMTIAGGMLLGLTREKAARFGFMIGFPILLGSGLKKLYDLGAEGILSDIGMSLFAGALAAFAVGLLVIHYLLKYLRTHTLHVFVWYRLGLAALILIIALI